MKRTMRVILANLGIILGMVFIVYIILDWYNAYMNFVGNTLSIKLLLIFCIVSIINGICLQVRVKHAERRNRIENTRP